MSGGHFRGAASDRRFFGLSERYAEGTHLVGIQAALPYISR
jgi:hypothetical protein